MTGSFYCLSQRWKQRWADRQTHQRKKRKRNAQNKERKKKLGRKAPPIHFWGKWRKKNFFSFLLGSSNSGYTHTHTSRTQGEIFQVLYFLWENQTFFPSLSPDVRTKELNSRLVQAAYVRTYIRAYCWDILFSHWVVNPNKPASQPVNGRRKKKGLLLLPEQ